MGVDEPLVKRVSVQEQIGRSSVWHYSNLTPICRAAAEQCLVLACAIGIP